MRPKHRRLVGVVITLLVLAAAAALVLSALEQNIAYFYSPTKIAEEAPPTGRNIRVGGLVVEDSVKKLEDGVTVRFEVTDLSNTLPIVYTGILPDLFREGQGIVAEGALGANGVFTAREVLAKHDETYMPAEVADALKKSGQWKPAEQ